SSITGLGSPAADPDSELSGREVACKVSGNRYFVEVVREAQRLKAALFHAPEGFTFDLLKAGADLGSWEWQPLKTRSTAHPFICSLSPDGRRLVVEGLRPPNQNARRSAVSKAASVLRGAYSLGRTSADSLILYDSATGHKLCELENAAGLPF